ncbi:MAG: agmatinase [Candidatus Thorarchaeota archaeon]|nr:MAG: agmatinase [Candidatus Thorarchaeota archaeon]
MPLRDDLNGFLKPPRSFFGIPEPEVQDPDVGVLGIPYDMTSSYAPGARFGPDAIRAATDRERSHTYPIQAGTTHDRELKPLSKLITLEDIGDLEVTGRPPESAIVDISEATARLVKHEARLLFLGGDHFITYPILRGIARGSKDNVGLVYLDAHADLYESYDGHPISHATTLRRIIEDKLVEMSHVLAHDLRSALPDQRNTLADGGAMVNLSTESFSEGIKELSKEVDRIYVSIDLDVMRPDIAPGVGHPESGGLDSVEIFQLLRACFDTGKVLYADLVELNPLLDKTGMTAVLARDIVKEILTGFALRKD